TGGAFCQTHRLIITLCPTTLSVANTFQGCLILPPPVLQVIVRGLGRRGIWGHTVAMIPAQFVTTEHSYSLYCQGQCIGYGKCMAPKWSSLKKTCAQRRCLSLPMRLLHAILGVCWRYSRQIACP